MTNQITQTEVEAIIDKLADKTLSFGCKVKTSSGKILTFIRWTENKGTTRRNFIGGETLIEPQWKYTGIYLQENGTDYYYTFTKKSKTKILGHSIFLGRVRKLIIKKFLKEYMGAKFDEDKDYKTRARMQLFEQLWDLCDTEKSLQQIAEKGWEEIPEHGSCDKDCKRNHTCKIFFTERRLKPPASSLFIFLRNILNE